MDDPEYNKLKQRIKQVFDDYDDTYANAGWLQLREKFPERRRRRAVWLWPAAAAVFLFLGLAIWMYGIMNKPVINKKISYNIKTIKSTQPKLQRQKSFGTYQSKVDTSHHLHNNFDYRTAASSSKGVKPPVADPSIAFAALKKYRDTAKQTASANPLLTDYSPSGIAKQTNKTGAMPADSTNKVLASNTIGLISDAQQKIARKDTQAEASSVVEPKTQKAINNMFAADQVKKGTETKVNGDKRVRFGVYAGTYFNYSKGSNNQVNVGAGFTADIALAGNFKMVTGLSINQNSFAYNSGSDLNFPSIPVFGNNSSGSNETYTQNASLLGLDIPLDLKYVLNSRKNQVYILAGVGSGTFINESYSYVNSNGSTTATAQPGKGFNDFYFARTMNMAIGVGYPLGNNQLVIEPFVKYPLRGLGAEQLRFGASGINLKFNFSIKK
jgi:hypothetical protein